MSDPKTPDQILRAVADSADRMIDRSIEFLDQADTPRQYAEAEKFVEGTMQDVCGMDVPQSKLVTRALRRLQQERAKYEKHMLAMHDDEPPRPYSPSLPDGLIL